MEYFKNKEEFENIQKAKMTGDFSRGGRGKVGLLPEPRRDTAVPYSILRNISGSFGIEKEQNNIRKHEF